MHYLVFLKFRLFLPLFPLFWMYFLHFLLILSFVVSSFFLLCSSHRSMSSYSSSFVTGFFSSPTLFYEDFSTSSLFSVCSFTWSSALGSYIVPSFNLSPVLFFSLSSPFSLFPYMQFLSSDSLSIVPSSFPGSVSLTSSFFVLFFRDFCTSSLNSGCTSARSLSLFFARFCSPISL